MSFDEALTVIADPLARIFDDEDHPIGEQREIIIGYSVSRRLLVGAGGSVRIFSAGRATKQERRDHEENVQS